MDDAAHLETLVRVAQRGDQRAFGLLVARFRGLAMGLAVQQLRDYRTAEEVAHLAFVRAWRRLPTLRDARHFPAWLQGIVLNVAREQRRPRAIRTVPLEQVPEPSAPQPDHHREERIERLFEGLASLPAELRVVLTLRYVEGLPYRALGHRLGIGDVAARSRVHRARLALVTHLQARQTRGQPPRP